MIDNKEIDVTELEGITADWADEEFRNNYVLLCKAFDSLSKVVSNHEEQILKLEDDKIKMLQTMKDQHDVLLCACNSIRRLEDIAKKHGWRFEENK